MTGDRAVGGYQLQDLVSVTGAGRPKHPPGHKWSPWTWRAPNPKPSADHQGHCSGIRFAQPEVLVALGTPRARNGRKTNFTDGGGHETRNLSFFFRMVDTDDSIIGL